MNDPLKTFLERARDGGLDRLHLLSYQIRYKKIVAAGMGTEAFDGFVLFLVFTPEAANAYWRWKLNGAAMGQGKKEWLDEHSKRMADMFQLDVLRHMQRGDTPIEALKKEL